MNDYKIEGKRTVENLGKDANDIISFKSTTTEGVITTPDGETITWNAEITRSWVEGSETGFFTKDSADKFLGINGILDDVYELTGSADGTDRQGQSYSVLITTALRVQFDCRWITEGVLELQPEDLALRTLDYGDGVCDNKAVLTIRKKTYDITLRN